MGETRMQVALKMCASAKLRIDAEIGKGADRMWVEQIWAAVEREALRGAPKFAK